MIPIYRMWNPSKGLKEEGATMLVTEGKRVQRIVKQATTKKINFRQEFIIHGFRIRATVLTPL